MCIVQVWAEVKQANPERSVCELGSVIGRMWRELGDVEKQPYFDSFTSAKVRCVLTKRPLRWATCGERVGGRLFDSLVN